MHTFRHWFDPPLFNQEELQVNAVGLREGMPVGIVDRPSFDDYMLMYFHDDAVFKRQNGQVVDAQNKLHIWRPGADQYYGNRYVEWCHSWVHLKGEYADMRFSTDSSMFLGIVASPRIESIFVDFLTAIIHEFQHGNPSSPIIRGYFDIFMASVERDLDEDTCVIEPVRRAKSLLEMDYRDTWSLQSLAQKVGISVPHLSSEFKKAYGSSPMKFLMILRMTQAKFLLKERQLRVGTVAELVGYPDIYHFSKVFKATFGYPPSALIEK